MGDITDTSISDIFENEYAQMKQKSIIWHKCKQAKLQKAAEEAKVCARKKVTEELEESLGFKLTEADKAELINIQEIDESNLVEMPTKKIKCEVVADKNVSGASKVDVKQERKNEVKKPLDP